MVNSIALGFGNPRKFQQIVVNDRVTDIYEGCGIWIMVENQVDPVSVTLIPIVRDDKNRSPPMVIGREAAAPVRLGL